VKVYDEIVWFCKRDYRASHVESRTLKYLQIFGEEGFLYSDRDLLNKFSKAIVDFDLVFKEKNEKEIEDPETFKFYADLVVLC